MLKRKMDELGVCCKFSTITDADLNLLVREYKAKKPAVLASVTSGVISVDLEYMFKNSMSQVHCSVSIPLGANPKTGRYSEAEVFQFSPKCPVAL